MQSVDPFRQLLFRKGVSNDPDSVILQVRNLADAAPRVLPCAHNQNCG